MTDFENISAGPIEISDEENAEKWQEFFDAVEARAKKIVSREKPDLFENPDEAVEEFMAALKRIYVDVSVEDLNKAVVEGVSTTVELAKKKKKGVLLVRGRGESGRVMGQAAKFELPEQAADRDVEFDVIHWDDASDEERRTKAKDCIVLVPDDVACSGHQKGTLALRIDSLSVGCELVFSFAGCAMQASERFKKLPIRSPLHVLSGQKITDLDTELKNASDDARRLKGVLFPKVGRGVAVVTPFRIPDGFSTPAELFPFHMRGSEDERKRYPDAL